MIKSVIVVLGLFLFIYAMSHLLLTHLKEKRREKKFTDKIVERGDVATDSVDANELRL